MRAYFEKSVRKGLNVLPSFSGVQVAEGWVRAQVDLYRRTPEPAFRRRLLMYTLKAFSSGPSLRTILSELSISRLYVDYSYRHNLGFYVIYLTDPEIGFQCRLHVWMPDAPPVLERPHRHRMGFASHILAGELRSLHYKCIGIDPATGPHPLADGDELHHETMINAPAEGSFDIDKIELQVLRDVVLRPRADRRYRTGDAYFFSAEDIHRVHSVEGRNGPSVTLVIWEPPFQPSLAYEPLGSLSAASCVQRPVMRVSEQRYLEVLGAVESALDAAQTGAAGMTQA